MISVLIADDHEFVREGIKKVLNEEPDISVCGEVGNGLDVSACVAECRPDVVILDLNMPGRSGLDVLHDLAHCSPGTPVVVLSMHPEERFAVRVLKAGALGYVQKQSAASSLVDAIRKVHAGGRYVSEVVSEQLAREVQQAAPDAVHARFSDREYQVFCLIAAGKSNKEIAAELAISIPTVKTHRARIMEKAGFRSNADLMHYAIQQHLIEP